MKKLSLLLLMALALVVVGCKNDEPKPGPDPEPEPIPTEEVSELFVVNGGNFGTPNSSLTLYNLDKEEAIQNVFYDANGAKLGDSAQSMWIDEEDNTAWICVSNSNVVFAIDTETFKEKGRIENIVSPRYFMEVADGKAYVSQMYTNYISIVDTEKYTVTGTIEIPGMDAAMGSSEELKLIGGYVYCNLWSYNKEVIKIDPATDKIVDRIETGIQPRSMAYDEQHNLLWVLNDGGAWDGNPVGYEAPTLVGIDLATFKITQIQEMNLGESVSSLLYNDGKLYWLSWGVYCMPVENLSEVKLPKAPLIENVGYFYALTINPDNGDIYVADAVDFMQAGSVYIYDENGTKKGSFATGIIPTNFCWYKTTLLK